jgi:acetyl esterase/lipase
VYDAWQRRRHARALASASAPRDNNQKQSAFLASRLIHDVQPLPDGRSSLLWIGDRRRASKFVLFFHGGGYIAPALAGHFEWCARAYLLASPAAAAAESADGGEEDEEVAVAFLQYTLCPGEVYPAQLRQAADALAHLLGSGVRPGSLVIGGDSAGGNLTAQVLGHLLRPRPGVREVRLAEPLRGAFLVSPLLSVRNDCWGSVARNGRIDMLSCETTDKIVDYVVEPREFKAEMAAQKGWAMPMDLEDPEAWFKGLDAVVREVYVTAGEQEILRDQGVEFADAVRRGNPGVAVKLEVSKDEAHDWILMEGAKGIDGDATKRMRAWFRGLFWE